QLKNCLLNECKGGDVLHVRPGEHLGSIRNSARMSRPPLHYLTAFASQILKSGQLASVGRHHQLLVQKIIIKAHSGCIVTVGGEYDASYTCPVRSRETHGAGFAAGVEGAVG